MEFKQSAPIFAANGEAVGHLDRVVVNADTKVITHIVAQKGGLVKEDKVVPVSLIAEASHDRINLREEAGDLHGLQDFEEKHYVMAGETGGGAQPVVSQPLAGMPGAVLTEQNPKFIKQVEQHIPTGTVAMKEGATVVAADGKHLGHVVEVMTEVPADQASHLLVSKGLLTKERKLVPMAWVGIIGEDEVHLTVEPGQVEALEAYPN